MDCNREEAIRARGIAEKKMENRDFPGAKKLASKAQQLYPDLENIMQMVLVCDVHCAAEIKTHGNEKDWYGILKVEPTADDALIRKQFRKLALLLHPDKNKFPGAADAFNLIGEAQKVLLDREKRMYNSRRIPPGKRQVPVKHTSCQLDTRTHPWVKNNLKTSEFMNQQGPQSGVDTFWTACPFCSVKYQYYKTLLNKLLWCQICKKPYTGLELNASDATLSSDRSQPTPKKNDAENQGHVKVSPQQTCISSARKRIHQKKVADETLARKRFMQSAIPTEVGQKSSSNGNSENACGKLNKEGLSEEHKKKDTKRKTPLESSENSDSFSSIGSEEDTDFEACAHLPQQNSQCPSEQSRRISTRSRQQKTYSENLSDEDEEGKPSKRSKGAECLPPTKEFEVQNLSRAVTHNGDKKKLKDSLSSEESLQNTGQGAEKSNERVDVPEKSPGRTFDLPSDIGPSTMSDPEKFEYPDPDFSDFDKDREESCFKVGQVWAVYDTLDAMPRFYAAVKKILSPTFKVLISWLEPDPLDEDETKWLSDGLPASCGRFRLRNSEDIEELPMFSHLVRATNGSSCNVLKIFPRKGETWAIFKDWDTKWYSHLKSKKKYSYEFVEVLSDYADDIGVHVAYLGKVKGFTCLFDRAATPLGKRDPFLIPAKEIVRFSHRVPSFKMTGLEGNDVPEGSFELDPASLPIDQFVCPDLDVDPGNVKLKSEEETSSVDPKGKSEGNARPANERSKINLRNNLSLEQREITNSMKFNCMDSVDFAGDGAASVVANEVPEPEFYKFDAERSVEKFQVGQFWAIYSDEDALPRYYGQIMKIDPTPNFALHVVWLYACPPPKGIIRWDDKRMPIGCGMFKFQNRKLHRYAEVNAFSHLVTAEPTDKKNVYMIFPRAGEIWAVYKNWSAQLKCDKLEDCEYEIVEIVGVTNKFISVKFLVSVNGFRSVYRHRVEEEHSGTVKIPLADQLKFSHQIPAFRLTEEGGGSLRGFWELDPSAMPVYLLCTD